MQKKKGSDQQSGSLRLDEAVTSDVSVLTGSSRDYDPHRQRGLPLVLVVEDSPTQALYLQALLDQHDLETVLASDGLQGLELARQVHPDLVVLDMEMPEMNGDEVLAILKDDADLWDIPVIMVSALDTIENVAHCIEMGAEDYLLKPFNATLLNARISASLEKKSMRDQERRYVHQIEAERARFDELLRVLLPDEIVEELESTGVVKPRLCPDVAVAFVDVVDFTKYCNDREPEEVYLNLQLLAEEYENLALKHNLQKIKTTGDTFLATAGLLKPLPNPVLNCVRCALDMVPLAQKLPAGWTVRVGIHVGPVMAGVVGRRKYLFDIWGNTVNTAQRIESHGKNGAVNLSLDAWLRVRDYCDGELLGSKRVKGKGRLDIYQVMRLRETVGQHRGN
jgi:class 3 adenylate cyclase